MIAAFYRPRFKLPEMIAARDIVELMDRGKYMFVVVIPPRFEADVRAGRNAELQVNIDATAMQQASIGALYIKNILADQVSTYLRRNDQKPPLPIELVVHKAFNPNGDTSWFTSIVAIINQVTMLTIILTGAALLREREHGTIEHLLVMPLTAFEIAMAKAWANGLVILVAATASLFLVVRMILAVPIAGSPLLVLAGVVLYLFFATALGVIPGHDHTHDGAVRAADHPADHRAANALGRKHADREPAALAATHDDRAAVAAFRRVRAGDHLSWDGDRYRLAAVCRGRRHRPGVFHLQLSEVPAIDRGQPLIEI
ncbi:MAG TPA: ABC transporter permease [Pirellulales bacterium]|jgi:ABC-type multidrug transport system permease subunit|nr:ABC transporter permease [Pirellulales bacterium]